MIFNSVDKNNYSWRQNKLSGMCHKKVSKYDYVMNFLAFYFYLGLSPKTQKGHS